MKNKKIIRKDAFTLIELLVVIAIISLLVSILLPSLQSAKELARQVACASKLKAIDFTLRLYAEDNDGQYPFGGLENYVPESPYAQPWYEMICRHLLRNRPEYGLIWPDSFMCPSEDVGFGFYTDDLFYYTHYGANYRIMGCPSYGYPSTPVDEIVQPSAAVAVMDSACKYLPGSAWLNSVWSYRHGDATNALHMDGHCEPREYIDLYDDIGYDLKGGVTR